MNHSAKYIADRIRLMITTKQFQVGELLPSTRELARQLDASFHTVRKAYHKLASEGLIRAERGRGFVVVSPTTHLDKSQRLEIGAEKISALLEELIGYGLDEGEIEALFEEQISFLEWPDRIQSSASMGETAELGRMLSDAIQRQVGVRSSVLQADRLNEAVQFDALFVPLHLVASFRQLMETQLILPVIYSFDHDLLLSIIDRFPVEAVGLITSDEKSIQKLIGELKSAVSYEGSIVAGATYGRSLPLFARSIDLILYTPSCAGLVEQKIPENRRLMLRYVISERSAETIRSELWDQ